MYHKSLIFIGYCKKLLSAVSKISELKRILIGWLASDSLEIILQKEVFVCHQTEFIHSIAQSSFWCMVFKTCQFFFSKWRIKHENRKFVEMAKKPSLKKLYTSYFSQDRTVWGWGSCLWSIEFTKYTQDSSNCLFKTSQLDTDFKPEILLKQLVTSVSVIIVIFTSPLHGSVDIQR